MYPLLDSVLTNYLLQINLRVVRCTIYVSFLVRLFMFRRLNVCPFSSINCLLVRALS
jgi:hypothetical protein